MLRILVLACSIQFLGTAAIAQQPALPPDMAGLPDAIKSLKWQAIDLGSVAPLERTRALLILNHGLDEVAASLTSQADLLSQYIDSKTLGPDFASATMPTPKRQLSYDDSVKIAVALLRGPMSTSQFADDLSGQPDRVVNAYLQMYENTCQRCWAEVKEARGQVRSMTAYLKSKGAYTDFEAWATTESLKRQQAHEKAVMAAAAADEAHAAEVNAKLAAEDRARMQGENPSNSQDSQGMQQLQSQNQQLQQTLSGMEQQMQQTAQNAEYNDNDGGNYYGWYTPPYYGADAAWYRDAGYYGRARANTADRYAGWHGASRTGVRR